MIVQEFRLLSKRDPQNDEQNWSRKYEYEKILRRIQSSRPHTVHNTSCGNEATHNKFKGDLEALVPIVWNSDIKDSPIYWDITEESPYKADMVLNISTLEHLPLEDREKAWDMLWKAVTPGGTLIYTFDHPEVSTEWLEEKTGETCVYVDSPVLHRSGAISVIYLELTKELS